MKKSTIILLTGGAVVAGLMGRYVYRNIVLAKDYDFKFNGFIPTGIRLTGDDPKISGKASLQFINKSDIKAVIKDINIQVFSKNVRLGAIEKPEVVSIAPKGFTTFNFDISFNPKSVVDNWRILTSTIINDKNIPMDFVGQLKVDTAFGFIKIPIKYSTTGKDLYALYQQYY